MKIGGFTSQDSVATWRSSNKFGSALACTIISHSDDYYGDGFTVLRTDYRGQDDRAPKWMGGVRFSTSGYLWDGI